jgi:ABC-type nitrate/sulfonate/bicarbonate transport system permease component
VSARGRRRLGLGLEVAVPIALVALWWVWSASSSSIYFPPLEKILESFRENWLFARVRSDVVPSLARLGGGFAIAVAGGVTVGVALGLSRTARRAADPIVEFLRAIPPPALIPFAIIVFGIGNEMKVFIIATVCIWPVLLNTIDGVTGIDPTLIETARSYGVGRRDRLRSVVFPAALPQIFAGMRTGLSLAIILMVISEMVASTNGIGYFILQAQRSFAIADMWSGILLLGLIGYLVNVAFSLVERIVLRWHRGARASALG